MSRPNKRKRRLLVKLEGRLRSRCVLPVVNNNSDIEGQSFCASLFVVVVTQSWLFVTP